MSLEGITGDLMGMKERPDLTPTLAGIKVPTLVLHGADDQIIPLQEAREYARCYSQCQATSFARGGSPVEPGTTRIVQPGHPKDLSMTKDEILEALEDEREKFLDAIRRPI